MTPLTECIGCRFLGRCKETSEDKVLVHYTCPRWEAEQSEVVEARRDTVRRFGTTILQVLVNPPSED